MDNKKLSKYTIGQRILHLRTDRELSQSELAKQADISLSAMFKIEKDKMSPNIKVLERIAAVLDCNPAIFFVTENLHVFDMKAIKEKYKKKSDLNDTLFRAFTEVVECAEKLGFCKRK